MHPQPPRLVARRKPEAPAEIEQDVGGLADDELAGLEERRRERRARDARAVDELHHRRHAALAAPARHVDIVGARLFQREPDELAAPLDRRPVIEFVAHDVGSGRVDTGADAESGFAAWSSALPTRTEPIATAETPRGRGAFRAVPTLQQDP